MKLPPGDPLVCILRFDRPLHLFRRPGPFSHIIPLLHHLLSNIAYCHPLTNTVCNLLFLCPCCYPLVYCEIFLPYISVYNSYESPHQRHFYLRIL